MIHMVQPLSIGNALRLFLSPLAGASRWRILRKGADDFAGVDDPAAYVVHEGDERVVLDSYLLKNDIASFYKPYYWTGADWVEGPTASGIPEATYEEASTDAQKIVRDRLRAGLQVEVARGTLNSELGFIQVYSAPPQISDDLRFPLVTVELVSEEPRERGIGEDLTGEDMLFDGEGWNENEGWLSSVNLSVIGWSLNPDERIELRRAIRRIIIGNLPVFDDAGMLEIELSMQDADFLNGEFGAPLYQCSGSFTCLAPVIVRSQVGVIEDVVVTTIAQP